MIRWRNPWRQTSDCGDFYFTLNGVLLGSDNAVGAVGSAPLARELPEAFPIVLWALSENL
jgi:hypothetical protein